MSKSVSSLDSSRHQSGIFLTVAHHLHADHASGPRGASRRHCSAHARDHAARPNPLAHHRSPSASHGTLGTPALLHGAPYRPITQHV